MLKYLSSLYTKELSVTTKKAYKLHKIINENNYHLTRLNIKYVYDKIE